MRGLPVWLNFALGLLAAALLLDTLSTYAALNSGFASEGNPILAHLLHSSNGPLVFLALKLFGFLLAVYIARLLRSRAYTFRLGLYALFLIATSAVFLYASLSNFALAFTARPLFS